MITKLKDLIEVLTQWNPDIEVDIEVERDVSRILEGVDILEVRARFKKYLK